MSALIFLRRAISHGNQSTLSVESSRILNSCYYCSKSESNDDLTLKKKEDMVVDITANDVAPSNDTVNDIINDYDDDAAAAAAAAAVSKTEIDEIGDNNNAWRQKWKAPCSSFYSMNRISLLGNLASEPDFGVYEHPNSSSMYTRFTLVTNSWKSTAKKSVAQFHRVIAWGDHAPFKTFEKGQKLFVEGSLEYNMKTVETMSGLRNIPTATVVLRSNDNMSRFIPLKKDTKINNDNSFDPSEYV